MGPSARNTKLKTENSVKVEPLVVGKDGGNVPSSAAPVGPAAAAAASLVVKEDTVKSIFTDNIQTSGAYSAREESLKREVSYTYIHFFCVFYEITIIK